jgi:hypothetical protein
MDTADRDPNDPHTLDGQAAGGSAGPDFRGAEPQPSDPAQQANDDRLPGNPAGMGIAETDSMGWVSFDLRTNSPRVLLSLRDHASEANLAAAQLPLEAVQADPQAGGLRGEVGGSNLQDLVQPESPGDVVAVLQRSSADRSLRSNSPANSTGEVWKSLGWLAMMILVFLAAITAGPMLVETYQYAATRGKMRAQYEAATDMLSKVSLRDSALASELVVHRIRPSVVSIQAGTKSRNRYRPITRGQGSGIVISEDGLVVTTPSTATSPASIRRCAFVRVSISPRATRAWSRRWWAIRN